jgi:hypothetical protein
MADYVSAGVTTALNGAIGRDDDFLVVDGDSFFPSARNFVIQIDDELLQVGSPAVKTFRGLVRGFGGTVRAAHADEATVTLMNPVA